MLKITATIISILIGCTSIFINTSMQVLPYHKQRQKTNQNYNNTDSIKNQNNKDLPGLITIKGITAEKESNTPITGVLVRPTIGDDRDFSDLSGFFQITMPGEGTLAFFCDGYKSVSYIIKESQDSLYVHLSPEDIPHAVRINENDRRVKYKKSYNRKAIPAIDESEYRIYINRHIKYPEAYIHMGKEGSVCLSFTVNKDGTLSGFKILKSSSKAFSGAAIDVIKNGPIWLPAIKKGRRIKSRVKEYYVNFIHI